MKPSHYFKSRAFFPFYPNKYKRGPAISGTIWCCWHSHILHAGISVAPIYVVNKRVSTFERVPTKGLLCESSNRSLRPLLFFVPLIYIFLLRYSSQQLLCQFKSVTQRQCRKSEVTIGLLDPKSSEWPRRHTPLEILLVWYWALDTDDPWLWNRLTTRNHQKLYILWLCSQSILR